MADTVKIGKKPPQIPQLIDAGLDIREKLLQKATLIYKMADKPSDVRSLALQIKELLK